MRLISHTISRQNEVPKRPKCLELRSSRWFITTVVAVATAIDISMYGMISPVTPTALRDRASLPDGQIQAWTSALLSLFAAALLVTSPIIGYVADRTESRRRPYVFGLFELAAATGLLCAGTHLGLWIVGRLCQGAAASVVWVVGAALLVDTVGKDGLVESIGYVSMAPSLGTVAGPLLGGVLYENG
ncbi:hypothetical protein QQS21_009097 [Conoideocrella luteorostrata]|uniref:Major facilitator superfamily (MFS) profile domain-containing protein n=1 Tax=Conoideocrella luteorostrata TaxID=1105319 RepID=A0AAJ0CHL4_9HYPO|nr:hypothetical protein QQS21_009097 [Conoideocrella luteorostrata]